MTDKCKFGHKNKTSKNFCATCKYRAYMRAYYKTDKYRAYMRAYRKDKLGIKPENYRVKS